ncbi:MAG TPA: sensor histidine kinase [Niabella sp.]|nr:sensor histidine kinase [Niabella sp.]
MRLHASIITVLFITLFYCAYSQTKTADSLLNNIHHQTNPDKRLEAILAFCGEYQSINRDTFEVYAKKAVELAAKHGNKKQKDLSQIAMANCNYRWGWVDSSVMIIDPVIKSNDVNKPDERDIYFNASRQKAMYLGGKNKFAEALDILYKITGEAEKFKDTIVYSTNINTIGSIALARKAPNVSLKWLRQALSWLTTSEKYDKIKAAIYANMSEVYNQDGKTDSALYFSQRSISLYKKTQLLYGLGIAYQRQAGIYQSLKQYDKAEASLKEMIKVRGMMSDGSMYTDDNLTLIDFYLATNQVDSAIAFCKRNLVSGNIYALSTERNKTLMNTLGLRILFYEALARCYQKKNDPVLYAQTLEQIISAKDSLNAMQQELAIADIQTKYDVQKKETTIVQQQLDISKKNTQLILYSSLAILVLMSGLLYFFSFRKKQKLKAEKAVLDAEEKERKRIAADLHDNLGVQANAILYTSELLKQEEGANNELTDNLNDTAKDMLFFLRETLWALKTADTTAAGLWVRIISFISQMRRNYKHIAFTTSGIAPETLSIPSAKALNILMIVQEAVNNAIKHSHAENTEVNTTITDKEWIITIRDNGKGFLVQEVQDKKDSHGLSNMQERARASQIIIDVKSNEDDGTEITLSIPLA